MMTGPLLNVANKGLIQTGDIGSQQCAPKQAEA